MRMQSTMSAVENSHRAQTARSSRSRKWPEYPEEPAECVTSATWMVKARERRVPTQESPSSSLIQADDAYTMGALRREEDPPRNVPKKPENSIKNS